MGYVCSGFSQLKGMSGSVSREKSEEKQQLITLFKCKLRRDRSLKYNTHDEKKTVKISSTEEKLL